MRTLSIFYTCTNCNHEFEIKVEETIPAQTYGPPESCYPAEGGEFDPEECPKCNAKADADAVSKKACDQMEYLSDENADYRREEP